MSNEIIFDDELIIEDLKLEYVSKRDDSVPDYIRDITEKQINSWDNEVGAKEQIRALDKNKQNKLTPGENITIDENNTISAKDTTNYDELTNKPSINNVELSGNKTLIELGIQQAGDYALVSETGNQISLEINPMTFEMTMKLFDKNKKELSSQKIDLPIESMVVNAKYENGKLILTLQSGQTLEVDISSIVAGLVNEDTFNKKVTELNKSIESLDSKFIKITNETNTNVSNLQEKHNNDILAINKEQEAQNAIIEVNKKLAEKVIKDNELILKRKASGNPIKLLDSSNHKITDFKAQGNTTQEVIEAEVGKEVIGTELTIPDANILKESRINVLGNTQQETREEQPGKTIVGENVEAKDVNLDEGRISVYGNTKQKTTKGYNLLPNNCQTTTIQGITWKVNEDKTIIANGTALEDSTFIYYGNQYNPGDEKYKIRISKDLWINGVTNGTPDTYMMILWSKRVDTGIERNLFIHNNTQIGLVDINLTAVGIRIKKGQKVNNLIFKPMITTEANKDKPYEPYTGGQASPNPDYPQEIENVKAYNLVKPDMKNTQIYDLTFTNNNDGTYTIKGKGGKNLNHKLSSFSDSKYKLLKGHTYTLSIFVLKGKLNFGTPIAVKDKNGTIKYNYITANKTITAQEDYTIETLVFYINEVVDVDCTFKIQFNEGEPKPYSPYGEIAVKQTGKNLFDIKSTPISLNTFYDNNGNFVNWAQTTGIKDYLLVEPNKDYIFSNYKGTGIIVVLYNQNKEIIKSIKTAKFQTTNDTKYIRFGIGNSTEISNELQIEEGTTATPYEPYKETIYPLHLEDIELNKIGEAQDYFHKVGSKWYLHKETGKYAVTGNENINKQDIWSGRGNQSNAYYFSKRLNNLNYKIDSIPYSNYFMGVASYIITTNDLLGKMSLGADNLIFRLPKVINTLEQAKQWFKDNPTEIIYQLETPTETLIEEPTLISQLNALENAKLFKPTTFLSNNSIANTELRYNYLPAMPSPEAESEIESVKAYNLLDISNLIDRLGTTHTINGNIINTTSNGTWSRVEKKIKFEPNKEYTILGFVKGTKGANCGFLVSNNDQTYQKYNFVVSGERKYIYCNFDTKTSTDLLVQLYSNWSNETKQTTATFEKVMILEGTFKDEQIYQNYGQIEVKQTGKNLFNGNYIKAFIGGKTGTQFEYLENARSLIINCKSNTNYSILKDNGNRLVIADYYKYPENKEQVNVLFDDYTGKINQKTIKTSRNAKYLIVYVSNNNVEPKIKVEEGTQSTSYEPYKEVLYPLHLGELELNKIGDIQDYFFKNLADNKWYLKKKIKKYEFTGNENNFRHFDEPKLGNNRIIYDSEDCANGEIKLQIYCNQFKGIPSNSFINMQGGEVMILKGTKEITFLFKDKMPNITSVETWKQFLKEKKIEGSPIIIAYQLATPQDIEITNPELIADLEKLYKAQLFEGTTILTNNSIAILKVNYNFVTASPSPERPSELVSDKIDVVTSKGTATQNQVTTLSTPIVLNGIGEVKDTLGDKVNRKIGVYEFTGEENWQLVRIGDTDIVFKLVNFIKVNSLNIICNRFFNAIVGVDNLINITLDNELYVKIQQKYLSAPNIEGFKKWLKDNSTKMIYELATPTNEEIPIENKTKLDNIETFYPETTISSNAKMDVEYAMDTQKYLDEIYPKPKTLQQNNDMI